MLQYIYKCFDCGSEYSSLEIEREDLYLCPGCGTLKKNEPLKGILRIEYDYDSLRKLIGKNKLFQERVGKFWTYPELWPLSYYKVAGKPFPKGISIENLEQLKLNESPIAKYEYNGEKLYVFDDTRSHTLSYKDRASILVALKAIQLNRRDIAAASTGNAGSSLAGICAKLGLQSHLFVPKSIPPAKRIQIQTYRSQLYLVDGSYDEAFDLCIEVANANRWYNRNTAYNPLTIEGKKSAAYDMYFALESKIPDYIFIPVGDGVILGGIYKGFTELMKLGLIEKLPKLVAVESEKSDALVRYLKTNSFEYKPAKSIADSLNTGAPRNLYMAAEAVRESNGEAVAVSDEEILKAQKQIASNWGILVEPAAAASLAGYRKLWLNGMPIDGTKKMILLTGNGLKDISSLEKSVYVPSAKSVEEWKAELIK